MMSLNVLCALFFCLLGSGIDSAPTVLDAQQMTQKGSFDKGPSAEELAKAISALDKSCENGNDNHAITNIALKKPARQSSIYAGIAFASRTVDGNTDGRWAHNSVAITNNDAKAFWEVDLEGQCTVHKVIVFNRVDCCGERLQNFDVVMQNFIYQPVKSFHHGSGLKSKFEFIPSAPVENVRYVKVQLRGQNYLQLAEVQVFGHCLEEQTELHNVALRKFAFQSSTYSTTASPADRAIDGNTDGKYISGSTAVTGNDISAWWEVDLGHTAEITAVIIFNRVDCCRERLSNFRVVLYNYAHQAVKVFHQPGGGNLIYSFVVNPARNARYVRVQLNGQNYLQIAEVEVIGKPVGGFENVALGKTAKQSSTYSHPYNPGAGLAVDGLIDGNFYARSTSITNNDPKAWWQVDLVTDTIVYGVTVFNRLDCCGDRLQNFDVALSDSNGKIVKNVGFGAGIKVAHAVHIPSGVTARKIKVQLRGQNYLQLGEVQVWTGARTCGGTGGGARCAFPFKYNGVVYYACTTVSDRYDRKRPWCGTNAGDVEIHGRWGFCIC